MRENCTSGSARGRWVTGIPTVEALTEGGLRYEQEYMLNHQSD
jgi:hypothetical protein